MIRTRSRLAVLPALAAFAVASHPALAQTATLRWKYDPGAEMVYRVANNQQMVMGAMGGVSVSEQIQTMRWRVVEVAPNGDATIRITTERVQVESQGMGGQVKYDSQTDSLPADPQARLMAAMAGLDYTMVIGPDGRVKSVRGLEEMREKLFAELPPQMAGMLRGMTEQMFSEETMTRTMQQSVQLFPEGPVGPGDSWNNSFSMAVPMLGTMNTNMTFTLNGIEERDGRAVAVIATAGEMVMNSDSTSQMAGQIEMSDTKLEGTIDFDVDRGITLASTISTNMQMTMAAGGQEVQMGMTQTSKVELIDYVRGR